MSRPVKQPYNTSQHDDDSASINASSLLNDANTEIFDYEKLWKRIQMFER